MPWFVDDEFAISKHVLRIPRSQRCQAVGLWALAGTWCVQQQEDGIVPEYVLELFGATAELANALVEAGLWERIDGGWHILRWRKHADGNYRKNIPAAVRVEVMERDEFCCQFCGAIENLSLDHIIRYRDGGLDTVENLRVLCMPCNLGRG